MKALKTGPKKLCIVCTSIILAISTVVEVQLLKSTLMIVHVMDPLKGSFVSNLGNIANDIAWEHEKSFKMRGHMTYLIGTG